MSEEVKKKITEFLADNKEMLVIIADPKSDAIVVGYKDQLTAHRLIHRSTGNSVGAVLDMLQYNKENKRTKDSVNNFLLVIDGAIHNISKTLKKNKLKVDVRK